MGGNTRDQNQPPRFKKGDRLTAKKFRDSLNMLSKSLPTNGQELPVRLYTTNDNSWEVTTEETPGAAEFAYKIEDARRVEYGLSSKNYDMDEVLINTEETIYYVIDNSPPDELFYAVYNKQSGRWEALPNSGGGGGKCDTVIFSINAPDWGDSMAVPEDEWDVTCWPTYYADVLAMESTSDATCNPCDINGENYDGTISVTDLMGHLFNESISNILDISIGRARRGEAKWVYVAESKKCAWVVTEFDAAPYCE